MFYLYRYRDAFHWKRKGALCDGEYSKTVEQDSTECICEEVLKTAANSNADFYIAKKIQREDCLCRMLTTKKITRDGRACS